MSIILTIIILGVLAMAHEWGHFIAAKLNHIFVSEFSIGVGPKILSWQGKETMYSLRLIPFAAYVAMKGGDEDKETEDDAETETAESFLTAPVYDADSFLGKKAWQKIVVMLAGPVMNLVVAGLLFAAIFMMMGMPSNSNILGDVVENSPAAVSGLAAGDEILSVNGIAISSWTDLVQAIRENGGEPLQIQAKHEGALKDFFVTPEISAEDGVPRIGITQAVKTPNVFYSVYLGFKETAYFSVNMLSILAKMFTKEVPLELTGPVGMVDMVGTAMSYGFINILYFAALLSINLAIFNLLPIPSLDGSKVLFVLLEKLRGKPIPPEKENMVHLVGIVCLMALALFVTYQDILKLFS
ncbi:MAG: RIP metalloprotease RseP [Peptococcaceae bacterium]|nr:RIP metalloprotease RseP [Peptococcaceae bacterium]